MGEYGVPEILESKAEDSLKAVYADIRHVLKMPIVNFMFRTLACHEPFLSLGWRQVRSNLLTFEGKKAAEGLRYPPLNVQVPHVNWTRYYEKSTLERIRATVSAFNYVNPKLLLIASAWAESLGNRPNKGDGEVRGTIKPGISEEMPSIELVQMPEAPPPIQTLLKDITEKHHHYEVADDFRALSRYPQFLRLSWQHLQEYRQSEEYILASGKLLPRSIELTKTLPYKVALDRSLLESYHSSGEMAGIMGIVSMFQHTLPDLIIDGEFLRRMLL